LVWRNEDGGPGEPDEIDPVTNAFVPREVGIEDMQSITSEARISGSYKTATNEATFAGGVRFSFAKFKRRGGGEGTTNSDFDLSVTGDWGYHLNFTTTNFAPFAENIFRIGNHLTLTPGFRAEFLNSTVNGYKFDDVYKVTTDQRRNRFFILGGFGIEYKTSFNAGFYGNISQAYRPIEYGQLQPFGRTAIIDPDLKDAKGFNSDLGYRFSQKNFLNADISLFYIAYNNRIGEVIKTDPATGDTYAYRTNIANSRHMGIESYIEFDLLKCMNPTSEKGVSVFNALSLINATYTNGEFKGNRVEAAAKIIERTGVTFKNKKLSSTFQLSYTGDAYGDASNVRTSTNPVAGYIPAYTVLDFSLTYKINNYFLKCGINNLGNKAYFTRRTDEYPGPGIIPAVGRSIYAGFTAKF
jgi:Fe(3+) dicitrate transport protein